MNTLTVNARTVRRTFPRFVIARRDPWEEKAFQEALLAPLPPSDEDVDEELLLKAADLIVVCSSAGKDSMALVEYVLNAARRAGVLHRVVIVHNNLGTTPSGQSVEWPGVEELARQQADRWGVRFETVARELGGLWEELLFQRLMWPSSGARWCTSDQKERQAMSLVTRLVEELGIVGRPAEVVYALGLRGEESKGRKAKPILAVDHNRSSSKRTIRRWHPIRDWTVAQVWDVIRAAGLRPHAAYTYGMSRLSCSACVLSSIDDLVLAIRLRPVLAVEYAIAEIVLGHDFQHKRPLRHLWLRANPGRRLFTCPELHSGPPPFVAARPGSVVLAECREHGRPLVQVAPELPGQAEEWKRTGEARRTRLKAEREAAK